MQKNRTTTPYGNYAKSKSNLNANAKSISNLKTTPQGNLANAKSILNANAKSNSMG